MEKKSLNLTLMVRNSVSTLGTYTPVWTGYTPFENSYENTKADLGKVDLQMNFIDSLNNGASLVKETSRKLMVGKTLKISGIVYAYAKNTGNQSLEVKMSLCPSYFERCRHTEQASKAQMVCNETALIINELETYKITQNDVDELQQMVSDFYSSLTTPQENIRRKAEARVAIRLLLENCKAELSKIDKMMGLYKNSHKEFFDIYFKARKLIALGHRHHKAQVATATVPEEDAAATAD